MKINIKEPYKTALILGVTISVFAGIGYLLLPNGVKIKISDFFKNKLKFKKDEREVAKTTDLR